MAKQLMTEVSDKYKLVGVSPGEYQFADFGTIDLCKVNVARADALVAAGFMHLVKRDKKEKEKSV